MNIINKADLIEAVKQSTGLTKKDAAAAVNATIDTIESTVINGDKLSLTGHFSLQPVARAARKGVNPSTGAKIDIPASTGIKFTAGEPFKKKVNAK